MFGAMLTDPTDPDADVGAFFFTATGYLPACVHSAIGVVTAGLECGFIPRTSLRTDGSLHLEIPAGTVRLTPTFDAQRVESITIQTAPAFVHTPATNLELDGGKHVELSITFSGGFFALVDVDQLSIGQAQRFSRISSAHIAELADVGSQILRAAQRTITVAHPDNPTMKAISLVMWFESQNARHGRVMVVNEYGGIDRSPCGAGVGAKVTQLFCNGELAEGQTYKFDSFLDTRFTGRVVQPTMVGSFEGAVPEVCGSAYVTGMHQFVLDPTDPLQEGFVF